jgi:predicted transcriptional regulator
MNHFVNKYKSDVEKVENARRTIEENEMKLLSIILDLWEKTESEELISIMDRIYQENIEVELAKSEIPKELVKKRKTQKEYAQELGITPSALSKRIKRRKKDSSTELKSKKREM